IQEVLGANVEIPKQPQLISPGVKYRHYSPDGNLHIFQSPEDILSQLNQTIQITQSNFLDRKPLDLNANNISLVNPKKIAILAYSNTDLDSVKKYMQSFENNSESMECKIQYVDTNVDYANKLYSFLLDCDKEHFTEIFCESPRQGRLFSAISNRLKKAISRDDTVR
ncbi:MAG: hypothetical protein JJT78_18200, partial [Leptospira sp.]|nr:hypothetical protein [Leptospira sp.]